jgi:hypothetical protein
MKVARPINKSTDIMVQHSIPSNRHVQHITSTLASKDVTGKWGDREREETERFLHCDVARVVWSFFYGLFGVEWVMPRSVLDLLSAWGTLLGRGPVHRVWKQVPLCVLWGLWRERNSRLFEDVEVQAGALCRNMLNMLFFWVSANGMGSMSYADFLLSCSFRSSN